MNPRERFLMALNHQEPDRVPVHDSPWLAAICRWRSEGMPADINPAEYFDFGMVVFGADTSPRFPVKTLDEDEEYITKTTPYGGLRRDHKDYSTTPEIVDYPVKSRDDWERLKERFQPNADRVDWQGKWLAGTGEDDRGFDSILEIDRVDQRLGLPGFRKARDEGRFITYGMVFGYDVAQSYVYTEELLMLIATAPDLVRDIYEVDAQLSLDMFDIMEKGGFDFDAAFIFCDLGYRNGLLFSPHHYDEQLRPTFRKIVHYFKDRGLPVILHSCGCVKELIPRFIEDGLTCLQPLEVKAGMDLVQLNKDFGDKLAFMGGIDTRAMADPDPSVIEREIKTKISLAKKGGGYIYHSDHSVPDNVSFEQYERTLRLAREYGTY